MVAQFRQIGVLSPNTANAEVRQQLRRAQQRTEALLNRPSLPRLPTLLNALVQLQKTIQDAYAVLPLQRLQQISQWLDQAHDTLEHGAFFGAVVNAPDLNQLLRRIYRDVTKLIVSLTVTPRKEQDPESDVVLKKFWERAAEHGWKVPDQQQPPTDQQDGFCQSVHYLQKVSVTPQALLPPDVDFGITTGSIVLTTEHQIPESTLTAWSNRRDVYIVFGQYIVLPEIKLLGMLPHLATGRSQQVDIRRFESISALVQDQDGPVTENLIRYPRRVRHHYYCPLVDVHGTDRRYFKSWDLLIKQD